MNRPATVALSQRQRQLAGIIGLVGIGLWVWHTQKLPLLAPALNLSKPEAIVLAKEIAKQQNLNSDKPWVITSMAGINTTDMIPRYLDDTFGTTKTRALLTTRQYQHKKSLINLDNFLPYKNWIVQFALHTGPQEERAESLRVSLRDKTHTPIYTHTLSENTPGKNLTQTQATQLATQTLNHYEKSTDNFSILETTSYKQPSGRVDWTFVFHQKNTPPSIDTRFQVIISGNQATSTYGYLHLPQTWQDQQANQQGTISIIQSISALFWLGAYIFIFYLTFQYYSQGGFGLKSFGLRLGAILPILLASTANKLPAFKASLNTTQPLLNQWSMLGIQLLINNILQAFVLCYLITYCISSQKKQRRGPSSIQVLWATGSSLGLGLIGIQIIASALSTTKYNYANLGALNNLSPAIAIIMDQSIHIVSLSLIPMAVATWWQSIPRTMHATDICKGSLAMTAIISTIILNTNATQVDQLLIQSTLTILYITWAYQQIIRQNTIMLPSIIASYYAAITLFTLFIPSYPGDKWQQGLAAAVLIILGHQATRLLWQQQSAELAHTPTTE